MSSTAPSVEKVVIDGPAGAIEGMIERPPDARDDVVAVCCHPHSLYGGAMQNKVVHTLARSCQDQGITSVRFNFRGVGASRGAFDDGNGETDDALAALAHARSRFGAALPLALGGFSFGSFVQTRVAERVEAERLVLVGPAVKRFAVRPVPADTIVIHGEQDDVVALADVLDWARPQELPIIVFPGCGHFFHGRLPQLQRTVAGMWHRHPAVVPGA